MRRLTSLSVLLAIVGAGAYAVPDYSLDPASLSVATIDGTLFGLLADDDINGYSLGADPIQANIRVFFSVDRLTIGAPGTAVFNEALPAVESAAADVYTSLGDSTNQLVRQESFFGLTTGFFGDDIDALEYTGSGNGYSYFTLGYLSTSNAFGAAGMANDIFLGLQGAFALFADGAIHIGLDADDDIDAFALWDVVNPGQLDPGLDLMLFSLSPFSPNTLTSGWGGIYSPADVFFTDFTGSFSVRFSAASLGLDAYDNLDGLDTEIVPEPSTLALAGLAAATALARRVSRGRRSI